MTERGHNEPTDERVDLGPERATICLGCCACEPGDWHHIPICDGSGLLPMEEDGDDD